MATITLKGNEIHTVGELPAVGSAAPGFIVTGTDLGDVNLADFAGKKVILNITPSIDTGICAASAHAFNKAAAALENTVIIMVTMDLPFAHGRFCGAEGIDAVITTSAFRSNFGETYGVTILDGPMRGLLSRSVVVLDADHKVVYTEQLPEIVQEPNYDAAIAALA